MMAEEGKMGVNQEDYFMHLESQRLKTFKNWPFENTCKCTPEKVGCFDF